jgi:hypothetical protein
MTLNPSKDGEGLHGLDLVVVVVVMVGGCRVNSISCPSSLATSPLTQFFPRVKSLDVRSRFLGWKPQPAAL